MQLESEDIPQFKLGNTVHLAQLWGVRWAPSTYIMNCAVQDLFTRTEDLAGRRRSSCPSRDGQKLPFLEQGLGEGNSFPAA